MRAMGQLEIPDKGTLQQLLFTAIQAAQEAAPQILKRFHQVGLTVEGKPDGSPVTIADKEAEQTIRQRLSTNQLIGNLDILGEEHGLEGKGTRLRWLVDPIDGTRSFINGIPLFGTLVALEDTEENRALIGVIHLPVLDLTYAAGRGLGSTCNGTPIHVTEKVSVDKSMITVGDPAQFASAHCMKAYTRLLELCPYLRGYTDCFGHAMVVGGSAGAMVDPALNPWDIKATQVLIEEAGGMILLRPSAQANKIDALFGNTEIVSYLDRELSFINAGKTFSRI